MNTTRRTLMGGLLATLLAPLTKLAGAAPKKVYAKDLFYDSNGFIAGIRAYQAPNRDAVYVNGHTVTKQPLQFDDDVVAAQNESNEGMFQFVVDGDSIMWAVTRVYVDAKGIRIRVWTQTKLKMHTRNWPRGVTKENMNAIRKVFR